MLNTFFLKRYFPGMCILLHLLCILLKRQCLWSESVCLWISNLSPTSSKHSSVVYFDRLIVCSATLGGKCHRLFSVVIIRYVWIIAECSIISRYWQDFYTSQWKIYSISYMMTTKHNPNKQRCIISLWVLRKRAWQICIMVWWPPC